MSKRLCKMLLTFIWTNTFYITVYLTSLSDGEISNIHSQISSSSQRHPSAHHTETSFYEETRAAALQASPPETASPCPKGYVVDRFKNNECVKRFVSWPGNLVELSICIIHY